MKKMDRSPRAGRPLICWAVSISLVVGCALPRESARPGRRTQAHYFQPQLGVAEGNAGSAAAGSTIECGNDAYQLFPPTAPWNLPVSELAVASDSAVVTRYLEENQPIRYRFQIDFSLVVLEATRNVRKQSFAATAEHYAPDCDLAPVPLLPGGRVEGEEGYACVHGGDCHLLVLARHECRLYEQWRVDVRGDQFSGGCQAVWDISQPYPENGRGEYCTSADAAGLPIAPFVFTPDDLARGEIRHALRFVLPNSNIRRRAFVAPATHSTDATSGPNGAPAYGAVLRLKPEVDLARFKPAAQIVIRALQRYGMYLADAGFLTFTGSDDAFSQKKWAEVELASADLKELSWLDFELIDNGPVRAWDKPCTRTPLTQ